jgi:GT2 family glycosyltransferase
MTPDVTGRSPTWSLVIATRHRGELLARCLRAVAGLTVPPAEVIVVDNSDGDAATRAIAEEYGCTYLLQRHGGLCAARNAGARRASTEIVCFLDDDAVADADWSAHVMTAFADPGVTVVTGRVLPLGHLSEVQQLAMRVGGSLFTSTEPVRLDTTQPFWFERSAFGGIGVGCNMAFRRSLFSTGFAFNEHTGRGCAVEGCDEHLAFLEALLRGGTIVYVPEAVVLHPVAATMREIRRNKLRDLRTTTGYMALLLTEVPSVRRRTLRYMAEGIRGVPRPWRAGDGSSSPRVAGRLSTLMALASGPVRYVAWRIRRALRR